LSVEEVAFGTSFTFIKVVVVNLAVSKIEGLDSIFTAITEFLVDCRSSINFYIMSIITLLTSEISVVKVLEMFAAEITNYLRNINLVFRALMDKIERCTIRSFCVFSKLDNFLPSISAGYALEN